LTPFPPPPEERDISQSHFEVGIYIHEHAEEKKEENVNAKEKD
jgi:hypothetical protein